MRLLLLLLLFYLLQLEHLSQQSRRVDLPTLEEINSFSLRIETLVTEKQIPYLEAMVMYSEENDYEIETVAKLISPVLKYKLQKEAEELNFLKKSNTTQLPF